MRSSGTQCKISGVFARTFLVAIVAIAPARAHHRRRRRFRFIRALIQCLSEALGGEGRAELRETTETAIAALPEPNTDKSWQIDSWRRRLAHRLAILADLEGDVDRYIAALCQGGLERAYIADIAGRLITSGRPTEALKWLSRSTRVLDEEDTAQIDLQVQALEALGSAVDILSKDVEHRILARLSEAAARL